MLSFSLELFDIRDNICRLKLLLWSDKFLLLFFFFLHMYLPVRIYNADVLHDTQENSPKVFSLEKPA